MHPSVHAAAAGQKPAIIMAGSRVVLTYAELEARSNQVAHLLRSCGLARGDVIAILAENGPGYLPLCWGAQRAGLVFTCLSTKLNADEVAYILADSGARAFFASAGSAAVAGSAAALTHRFAISGSIPGFEDLDAALARQPATRIEDESPGRDMLYSSGTTGRPKGISGPMPEGSLDAPDTFLGMISHLYGFGPESVYLSPAPLYHAAPLKYSMAVHRAGGTVVIMKKFDPEVFLATIERYRVTHTQLVPTMFVRMLKLPPEVRARYDLSSLHAAIHAAAPCPVEVKTAMLDWWGPRIYEYYSATEGAGFTAIGPQEWLARPGSVGKALLGQVRILGDDDAVLPPGQTGRVFFHGGPTFRYHNREEPVTGEHGATFGDIGHVDADGYLYLTDRASYMIISGGVNIYPQESENALALHPEVADVAVYGIPDPEMGEAVHAVVQPRDMSAATPELAADIIAFARARVSHVKAPRTVEFMAELPRHETGKLYKRLLRDRHWA